MRTRVVRGDPEFGTSARRRLGAGVMSLLLAVSAQMPLAVLVSSPVAAAPASDVCPAGSDPACTGVGGCRCDQPGIPFGNLRFHRAGFGKVLVILQSLVRPGHDAV